MTGIQLIVLKIMQTAPRELGLLGLIALTDNDYLFVYTSLVIKPKNRHSELHVGYDERGNRRLISLYVLNRF